jgi:multidrug efflux pump subunit AcrB
VAGLVTGPGPSSYRHFDGERTTTIEADVDQDIITSLEATAQALEGLDIGRDWPGLTVKTGGEAQESQESMTSLFVTFGIALIGVYFLLVLLFDSFTQPLLVIVAVPFGIVGVIITFALHGQHLSFLGLLGIIGLAGVVVNDSLVLVDHINRLRREKPDTDFRDLVAEGTSDRLRAIILTSLTTVAGLLPLAYGIGGADLYMQPMALALGYGILFATPLTLLLVPCLFVIGNDIRRLLGGSARRQRHAAG